MGGAQTRGTKCIFGCEEECEALENVDRLTQVPVELFHAFLLAGDEAAGRGQHREILRPSGRRTLRRMDLPACTPRIGACGAATKPTAAAEADTQNQVPTPQIEADICNEASTEQIEVDIFTEASTPQIEADFFTQASTPQIETDTFIHASTPEIKADVFAQASTPRVRRCVSAPCGTAPKSMAMDDEDRVSEYSESTEASDGGYFSCDGVDASFVGSLDA